MRDKIYTKKRTSIRLIECDTHIRLILIVEIFLSLLLMYYNDKRVLTQIYYVSETICNIND